MPQDIVPVFARKRKRRLWLSVTFVTFCTTHLAKSFCVLTDSPIRRRPSRPSMLQSTRADTLRSLTVKELRQMVKDSPSAERGMLSRLKRKKDLVEFLENTSSDDAPITSAERNGVRATDFRVRRNPLTMPPVEKPVSDSPESPVPSPRDAIFERVYQRYPTLQEYELQNNRMKETNDDLRQSYHPIYQGNKETADMDVIFCGTASCTPSVTRGVSCTALRLNWKRRASFVSTPTSSDDKNGSTIMREVNNFQGGTWLFDVGECTQLQVQRTTAIRPSKITKIFLTHAHGDHTFGLPGLLCLMGQDRDRENAPPVDIYGPEGLRMWLRVAIRYSVSRIVPPYRVHEIMDVPMAPEWEFSTRSRRYFYRGHKAGSWGTRGLAGEDALNWISQANRIDLEPSELYGEIDGGRDVYPIYGHPLSADGAPVWEVEDEEDVKVYAAPMSHGIPCLGYVVEESTRPGRLRNDYVEPIVKRNINALRDAGFRSPMKAMAIIKNLQPGSAFTFPDGTVVTQEDAVDPPRKGRKVVYCGDTADSRALVNLARDADVVIHECTNAYLQGIDKDTNMRVVTRDAMIHGHSTPQIAGNFCKKVNGKRLLLNHFSARYKGDISVDSLSIMMRIELQAMKAAGLNETSVAAAWDLMTLPIPCH